jgi:hypothetical protein
MLRSSHACQIHAGDTPDVLNGYAYEPCRKPATASFDWKDAETVYVCDRHRDAAGEAELVEVERG